MREAALTRRVGHPAQGRRHREGGGRGELEDQEDRDSLPDTFVRSLSAEDFLEG